jgi:hypothetical protein
MTDRIDSERRDCVAWISRVLADPSVAAREPVPQSDQMEPTAWALMSCYHATLAEVAPNLIPGIPEATLNHMLSSRTLESAGMAHYPRLRAFSARRESSRPARYARRVAALVVTWNVLLGSYASALLFIGLRAG